MTTLAIIGSGLAGRSLIYALAKEQKQFEKITVFSSDKVTIPCTLNSTAVASLRGTTSGHSPLGDSLVEGFEILSEHVKLDCPRGVEEIIQYSAATEKLDQFKNRFKGAELSSDFLKSPALMAREKAYVFDPQTYLDWLLEEAMSMEQGPLEMIDDLVVEVEEKERIHVKTLNGRNLAFDKVVFACGSYNRFWHRLAPETKLKTSKPAQGSYFEFHSVDWSLPSFSLTLDGDNIVWNRPLKRLYVGSTTTDATHYLPPVQELKEIYQRLQGRTTLELPPMDSGLIRTGLREKAQKREPYLLRNNNIFFFGGLYKNAFTVSLKMARNLSHQLP